MTWIPDGESAAAPVPLRASALTDPVAYIPQNPGWSLTDGEWSTLTTAGGDTLALHEGDPYGFGALSPGVHEARARLRVTATTQVHVDVTWRGVDGAEYVMADGPAETIPAGEWGTLRRTWEAPAGAVSGSIAFQFQASPGNTVRVSDLVWAAHDVDAPVVIVADQIIGGHFTGETFEGGAFVGGEFRTSDTLPGQVILSDAGFEDPLESGIPGPGVGVTPRNPDGFTRFPGVGPSWGGMTVSGGRDATGRWATVEASPTSSTLRAVDEGGGGSGYISTAVGESRLLTSGPDGETGEVRAAPTSARLRTRTAGGAVASEVNASPTAATTRTYGENGESGWMRARPVDVELAYVDSLNTYFSRIRATETEASLFTRAGGTNRYLTVDADGIWVKSGSRSYNLEGTAWDTLSLGSGWSAYTGGGGYYNGLRAQRTPLGIRLDGMIQGGGTGQIAPLPATMQDVAAKQFPVVTQSGPGVMGIHRRSSDGWWVVSYLSGPATPGWISVSVDATLA